MRSRILVLALGVALLAVAVARAQVFQLPNQPPEVTSARSSWQINGDPVYFAGDFYFPAGPTVFFDGNVMVRTGTFQGVPLYADTTLEPYSVVYVPIGGRVMRPYERRRAGELAGTVGSRMPSFPIERDVELSSQAGSLAGLTPPLREPESPQAEAELPTGTSGSLEAPTRTEPWRPTHIESIPAPESSDGIWIEYLGVRWYSAGEAVSFEPDHFSQIGDYHGFPVYRATKGAADEVFVPAVQGGALVPYKK